MRPRIFFSRMPSMVSGGQAQKGSVFYYFGSIALGLVLLIYSGENLRDISRTTNKNPVLVPPAQIQYFTFGFSDIMADLLWIRAIQAFDFCGETFTSSETVTYGETNTVHPCQKGWVFQMLDAATRIAPRYGIIYRRGAANLSVIVSDREGAQILYERGVATYPKDWRISYQAGYHEIFEMNDPAKAAVYFEMAGSSGAPNWVPLLAAKLYNQAGRAEMGLRILAQLYEDKDPEEWPERAKERWGELEAAFGRKVDPREYSN